MNAAAQSHSGNGQAELSAIAPDPASSTADHGQNENLRVAGTVQTGSSVIPAANPLWAIPLGSLTSTRQRPIFTSSRRPPPDETTPPQPAASEPLGPPLVLLGAVASKRESIAILRDQVTKDIVRLKIGESHSGWTLRLVNGREATFNKGRETSVLLIEIP
jgi:general secretion pathway protein N